MLYVHKKSTEQSGASFLISSPVVTTHKFSRYLVISYKMQTKTLVQTFAIIEFWELPKYILIS